MMPNITADEQKKMRSEIEEAQRLILQVLLRLKPLERADDRVARTEQALSACERLLWVMTCGPGRLGPSAKVRPILVLPSALDSGVAAQSGGERKLFLATSRPAKTGTQSTKEVQSAHA